MAVRNSRLMGLAFAAAAMLSLAAAPTTADAGGNRGKGFSVSWGSKGHAHGGRWFSHRPGKGHKRGSVMVGGGSRGNNWGQLAISLGIAILPEVLKSHRAETAEDDRPKRTVKRAAVVDDTAAPRKRVVATVERDEPEEHRAEFDLSALSIIASHFVTMHGQVYRIDRDEKGHFITRHGKRRYMERDGKHCRFRDDHGRPRHVKDDRHLHHRQYQGRGHHGRVGEHGRSRPHKHQDVRHHGHSRIQIGKQWRGQDRGWRAGNGGRDYGIFGRRGGRDSGFADWAGPRRDGGGLRHLRIRHRGHGR